MSSDHVTEIGPYRIVETLGEGGMGVVYLAEQSEPVRRQVALKILKVGADSAQVLARFEAERQALAVMDHPSIAKIFDAGVLDDGRSYFVMERVEGTPITQYCDENRLTVRARAALFVHLCHAVQHAHQKGVIHRDLKPSNVLVTVVDGSPRPRVIDFGIAKAIEAPGFDGTQLTRDDQIVGTPAYMSPEQINGSGDIDTRSDIYALGVLLYEVLLGALPYDKALYRGWAAIAATLHRDPPGPARRFDELSDTQETLADHRSTTPSALRRELSGDIGWVCARAMERDRDRRYESATEMAADVARYLEYEPIRARGSSTAYVVRKFARRNRLGVALGSMIALGLLGFSVVMTVQAERIARARDEADTRRGQADRLIDFMLSDLREKLEPLGQLNILSDLGDEATQYFSTIPEGDLSDEELANRSLALRQIGSVRLDQGDSQGAVAVIDESVRLARALSDRQPDNPDRLFDLSQSYFYAGYGSFLAGALGAAEVSFLGYLAAAERLVELDAANPTYQRELSYAHSNLGSVWEAGGDLRRAADAYARTLEARQALVDLDPTAVDRLADLAEMHNKIGVVNRKMGLFAAAVEQHALEVEIKRKVLEMAPTHANWRFRAASALYFLAGAHKDRGELEEALRLLVEETQILDSLSSSDPTNARWRRSLARGRTDAGEILGDLGRFEEAHAALDRAEPDLMLLSQADSTAPGRRFDLAIVLIVRSELYLDASSPAAALDAAGSAVELVANESSPTAARARTTAASYTARGRAYDALGEHGQARDDWAQALASIRPYADGPEQMNFRPQLSEILLLLDRPDDAQSQLDALSAAGFVDRRLQRLATAKGAHQ